jgi:hypothetical protein
MAFAAEGPLVSLNCSFSAGLPGTPGAAAIKNLLTGACLPVSFPG